MIAFNKLVGFEWDKNNINKIYNRHKVTIKDAEDVFSDEFLLLLPARPENDEVRYAAYGNNGLQNLVVIFTVRNLKIRVISARPQSRIERRIYEEYKKAK